MKNTSVSMFTRCTAKAPKDIKLLDWLTTDRYKNEVLRIRSTTDETAQKRLKEKLPVIAASGRFSGRSGASLVEHSGFIQFDIDEKDNRHLANLPQLKDEIKNLTHVAFCGLSVRGQGLWGLVPVPPSSPEDHKRRFDALANDFDLHGIILDRACSEVNRLRFASYDPDAYFNLEAVVYRSITPPVRRRRAPGGQSFNPPELIDEACRCLESAGWVEWQPGSWTRPGKSSGNSGTMNVSGVFYCYTASAEPLEPGGYSPLRLIALLDYGGDYAACEKALTEKFPKLKPSAANDFRNV